MKVHHDPKRLHGWMTGQFLHLEKRWASTLQLAFLGVDKKCGNESCIFLCSHSNFNAVVCYQIFTSINSLGEILGNRCIMQFKLVKFTYFFEY